MTFEEMYPELAKLSKEKNKKQIKTPPLPESATSTLDRYLTMRGKCFMAELKI